MAKLKVLKEIDSFTGEKKFCPSTPSCQTLMNGETPYGVLSSNKKVFSKIATNKWQYIPDTKGSIEEMCTSTGLDEISHLMTEDGGLQYPGSVACKRLISKRIPLHAPHNEEAWRGYRRRIARSSLMIVEGIGLFPLSCGLVSTNGLSCARITSAAL